MDQVKLLIKNLILDYKLEKMWCKNRDYLYWKAIIDQVTIVNKTIAKTYSIVIHIFFLTVKYSVSAVKGKLQWLPLLNS